MAKSAAPRCLLGCSPKPTRMARPTTVGTMQMIAGRIRSEIRSLRKAVPTVLQWEWYHRQPWSLTGTVFLWGTHKRIATAPPGIPTSNVSRDVYPNCLMIKLLKFERAPLGKLVKIVKRSASHTLGSMAASLSW